MIRTREVVWPVLGAVFAPFVVLAATSYVASEPEPDLPVVLAISPELFAATAGCTPDATGTCVRLLDCRCSWGVNGAELAGGFQMRYVGCLAGNRASRMRKMLDLLPLSAKDRRTADAFLEPPAIVVSRYGTRPESTEIYAAELHVGGVALRGERVLHPTRDGILEDFSVTVTTHPFIASNWALQGRVAPGWYPSCGADASACSDAHPESCSPTVEREAR